MSTHFNKLSHVSDVANSLPNARRVLHSYGIDPTSSLTLAQAAAAASTTSDEVLAIVEARMRRAQRRQQRQPVEQRPQFHEEVIEEGEFAVA